MRSLQKPQTLTLGALLTNLSQGQYVIPDFQREFEWAPWDVRDLVKSIFQDYFIGSLLMWKGTKQNFSDLSCESIYGVDTNQNPNMIVLDGQQRLTAINYAFRAPDKPLPSRKIPAMYFVNIEEFFNEQYDQAFYYDWKSRSVDSLLNDRERQFHTHTFPCKLIGTQGFDLYNWLQDYERYWREIEQSESTIDENDLEEAKRSADNANTFGRLVNSLLQSYQISYIELDSELPIDVVCDIFTKLNSKGVRLDVFDLLNALLKPKGIHLKELWRDSQQRIQFIEANKLNIYVLQVFSILRQTYCSPKYLYYLMPGSVRKFRDSDSQMTERVLVQDAKDFEQGWTQAVKALERAIRTVQHPQEYGAIGPRFVPYTGIFPILAALLESVAQLPNSKQLSANDKIRQWYWASVFSNRYSGSTESTSATDYRDLNRWFESDDRKPEWITLLGSNLESVNLAQAFNTGSSTYKGVFNLLVRSGARDWSTGMIPNYGDLDDHHIVPKSWRDNLSDPQMIDSVLNRTPLSSATNRNVIRDRLPNEYLPEMIESSGKETTEKIMRSHLVSAAAMEILLRNPFTKDDYQEFLLERRITISESLRSTLLSQIESLPPDLRDLDDQVRQIELGLRRLIDSRLHSEPGRLPSNIRGAMVERVRREANKNPMVTANTQVLIELLEYSDLRELQQIIVNSTCWDSFIDIFKSKPELEMRFEKLASLRNAIRHDRSVLPQVRIDGSASMHWFKTLLDKYGDEQFTLEEEIPIQSEEGADQRATLVSNQSVN